MGQDKLRQEESPMEQRRNQIVELVNRKGSISFAQLKEAFPSVSEMTLRTDLKALDEARRVVREGVDPAYVQRIRRASFGASIKSLNSFEAIASTVSEGCFQGYDPFRFPEVYDSITQQDLLDFIRDNIRPERMALSIIYPKE